MAVDKNKIVAEATRFTQKGQFDKALKAYEKILAEDRKEVRTLLKVGELQQKKGDSPAAAATFNQVAEIYGEQGFFLKAVAVYKQIAKLTPADVRVNEKLAGLYQQLGLLNDATNQLQAVAAAHEKAGDQGRHLDVLRRLLDLDPENVVTCQRLGDLYAKANRPAEALELYRRAAAHLKENKRGDEYVKLAERIYQLTPDDLKLARELAQEYLARGDTKKALGKLQICHGADKQDVDTLRLMAQAFRDLGQVSKTIAVYRALARVYAERGRRDEAASTWRMVQELLPDDAEARDELAASGVDVSPPAPSRPPSGAMPSPFTPQPGASPPVVPPVAPPVVPARVGTPAPRPAVPRPPEVRGAPPQVARPPPGAPQAAASPIARIFTETDVYLKYGLHAKALEHVQKVLETDPENPDALERVRDIKDVLGDRPGAAEAAERTVKALLQRGDEARIAHATQRLRELDPSHAEVSVEPAPQELSAEEPAPAPVSAADELPLPDDEPAPEAAPPPPEAIEVEPPEPHETIVVVPPDEEGPRVVAGPEGPAPVLDDEAPGAIDSYSGIPLEEEVPPPADEPLPPMVLGDDSPLPVDDGALQVEPAFPGDEAGPPMDVDVEVEEIEPLEPPPLPPPAPVAPV
ncbi:MAG: tetratricopeptide repeat protein, partial [Deltaproteobacteria bacterium]